MTYQLSNINWRTTNTVAVDFEQLPDTYTAVANYTGTATKSYISGYTTTADYVGTVSKTTMGKVEYTAYFSGTKVEEEKVLTAKELKEQLKATKKAEKLASKGDGVELNPVIFGGIFGVALLGIIIFWLTNLRKNVTVYNSKDGQFKVIGKVMLSKGKPIIDLTPFTSKVINPSFMLVLGWFTAKRFNGKTITINYGGESFQHEVTVGEEDGKKEYSIDVNF